MTNKLAKTFNWAGNNNKTPFKNTKCFEAVQGKLAIAIIYYFKFFHLKRYNYGDFNKQNG